MQLLLKMKQKLLKKKFSSKDLELKEIKKIKNILTSWTNLSLIRFFTGIFFNKENFNKLFDLRILMSLFLYDLTNVKKNYSFFLNTLMFLIFPFFLYFFNSNLFFLEKKDITINNSEKRFYTNKWEKNKKIYIKNFCQNFYLQNFVYFFISYKKLLKSESRWWKKKTLQNLYNWGESDDIILNSYFFLKKKKNNYFQNYIEFCFFKFYKNCLLDKNSKIFLKKNELEFLDVSKNDLKNPKFILFIQKSFSSYIYNFSKKILFRLRKKKIIINFSIKQLKNNNQFYFYKQLKNNNQNKTLFNFFFNLKKNSSFTRILTSSIENKLITTSFHFNSFLSINTKKNNCKFYSKILKSLAQKKTYSFLNHIVYKKENVYKDTFFQPIYSIFFNILLIDDFQMKFFTNKKNIKKKFSSFQYFVQSDNTRFVKLCKFQNYLLNYSIFLNPGYEILQNNICIKKSSQFFKTIFFNLLTPDQTQIKKKLLSIYIKKNWNIIFIKKIECNFYQKKLISIFIKLTMKFFDFIFFKHFNSLFNFNYKQNIFINKYLQNLKRNKIKKSKIYNIVHKKQNFLFFSKPFFFKKRNLHRNFRTFQNNKIKTIYLEDKFYKKKKNFNLKKKHIKKNLVITINFNEILFYKKLLNFLSFEIKNHNFLFQNTVLCSIYNTQNNLFNTIFYDNKKLLKISFEKSHDLSFLDFLNKYHFNYNKKFLFYSNKKNYNLLYLQLLKNFKILNQKSFFFTTKRKILIIKNKISNLLFSKKTILLQNSIYIKLNKLAFYFFYNDFIKEKKFIKKGFKQKKRFNVFLDKIQLKNSIKDSSTLESNIFNLKNDLDLFCFEIFIKIYNKNNRILKIIKSFFFSLIYQKDFHSIIINQRKNYYLDIQKMKKNTKIYYLFFKDFLYCYYYKLLFFTFEWWEHNFVLVFNILLKKIYFFINFFFYVFIEKNYNILKKLNHFYIEKFVDSTNIFFKWNLRLLKEIDYSNQIIFNKSFNNIYFIFFTFFVLFYLNCQQFFSIIIGSDFFYLWNYFNLIQNLFDTSRGLYIKKLINNKKIRLNKTENLGFYFFKKLTHYIKNFHFYFFTKNYLKKWLVDYKSLDLSRRNRRLLVQSLITKNIESNFKMNLKKKNLFNYFFLYRTNQQQGVFYFKNLVSIFQKKLLKYSNFPFYLAERWIFFAFWQKILSLQILRRKNKLTLKFYKTPSPFQFGLSASKGILLVGPRETGRAYLIKNLSKNSHVPLLQISIKKLLYNKPDVITENWMNILIESLRRLNLTLEFAKKMSPCIIWIQNIHQLNINHLTQNVESDPTFLLGILLKYFQDNNKIKNNIIVIGSTSFPKKVDPALISPNRLDKIINIRILNVSQRHNQFENFLYNKKFYLKKNRSYLNEFGFRTMGYNMRDLMTLFNEVLLLSIKKNQLDISINTLRLAFSNQIFGFSHVRNNLKLNQIYKILLYKIGKVVIQNILIKNFSISRLNIENSLFKKKFYYLSKWYLESSINQSFIKEITIFTHILSFLAGAAARDCWFILENKKDNLIPIENLVENDFLLAFSIFESLFFEFPSLEIIFNKSVYQKENIHFFSSNNCLNIIQNGSFLIGNKRLVKIQNDLQYKSSIFKQKSFNNKKLQKLSNNITWSPRIWRFSFFRSHFFNYIKRQNEFEYNYKNLKKEEKFFSSQLIEKKEQFLYERILPRIRQRNIQELEAQFKKILFEEQFEILGFSRLSTQYRMEYKLSNKLRFFLGKQILWDPTFFSFESGHFIFSHREFFTDEEMLKRLYVTYGAKREKSRSSQKIKQFFMSRGYNKNLINNFPTRWWNQVPINKKKNIDTIKRIEQIGVQLKRPQIITPVYLYQRWLIENSPEKFARFEFFNHRLRWLNINNSLWNDSFLYQIFLESYQYLLNFFFLNKILLNEITKKLLKNGWLFQNEIESFILKIK